MNYVFILLGIIIVFLLFYILYNYLSPSKSKITETNYLKNGVKSVPFTNLDKPSSNKYSIEIWVYVNDLSHATDSTSTNLTKNNIGLSNPGNPKGCIFEVSGGGNSIYHLDLFKNKDLCFFTNNSTVPSITVTDFPLQKWCYVVISVDNTLVDMYLDGKLIQSVKGSGRTSTIPTPDSIIYFGKGDIFIAGMNRIATTTDTNTVFTNYMKGNTYRLSTYSVSLDFMKDDDLAKKITLV